MNSDTLKDYAINIQLPARRNEAVMLKGEVSIVDPVMFDELNESKIMSAALLTKGAAGPSGMDSENWRRMLVSKNYAVTAKSYSKRLQKWAGICEQKRVCQNFKHIQPAGLSLSIKTHE